MYVPSVCRKASRRLQPDRIAWLPRATARLLLAPAASRLQYIINMHPLVGVVALSPHVAERVRTRMRMHHVHWMMPVLPVACDNSCWEGFAVQGK